MGHAYCSPYLCEKNWQKTTDSAGESFQYGLVQKASRESAVISFILQEERDVLICKSLHLALYIFAHKILMLVNKPLQIAAILEDNSQG